MPKGVAKKPEFLKTNEVPRNNVVASDEFSTVDKGHDFVKAGETAQIGRN